MEAVRPSDCFTVVSAVPSGRLVVCVSVPVVLLTVVETVEPSGCLTVVVLEEEPEDELPPEEELPPEDDPPPLEPPEEEPPPVAGSVSRTISQPQTVQDLWRVPFWEDVAGRSTTQSPAVWAA